MDRRQFLSLLPAVPLLGLPSKRQPTTPLAEIGTAAAEPFVWLNGHCYRCWRSQAGRPIVAVPGAADAGDLQAVLRARALRGAVLLGSWASMPTIVNHLALFGSDRVAGAAVVIQPAHRFAHSQNVALINPAHSATEVLNRHPIPVLLMYCKETVMTPLASAMDIPLPQAQPVLLERGQFEAELERFTAAIDAV